MGRGNDLARMLDLGLPVPERLGNLCLITGDIVEVPVWVLTAVVARVGVLAVEAAEPAALHVGHVPDEPQQGKR